MQQHLPKKFSTLDSIKQLWFNILILYIHTVYNTHVFPALSEQP